jgi:transposase InsO family protein
VRRVWTKTLRKYYGVTCSLNRIQARMRAMGLRARAAKRYKITTESGYD